jgi:hypothetical protein
MTDMWKEIYGEKLEEKNVGEIQKLGNKCEMMSQTREVGWKL